MTQGVDLIIGNAVLNNQSSVSGNYGPSSLPSGIYKKIEEYENDMQDVMGIAMAPFGSNRLATIILHK